MNIWKERWSRLEEWIDKLEFGTKLGARELKTKLKELCQPKPRKKINAVGYDRHGLAFSSTYRTWIELKRRHKEELCGSWRMSFLAFLEDMGEKPEGSRLVRTNKEEDYDKTNCAWYNANEKDFQNKSQTFTPIADLTPAERRRIKTRQE